LSSRALDLYRELALPFAADQEFASHGSPYSRLTNQR
jgi:hypothetical protein